MAPLRLEESVDSQIYKVDSILALQFINDINASIVKQIVVSNILKQIGIQIGNIDVIIPVEYGPELQDVPIEAEIVSIMSESTLDNFNTNKRMARYLVEYVLWMFSKFILQNNNIGDRIFDQFVKERIIVDNTFIYGDIKKRFSSKSGFMKNKKLVVTSEEMLKRLIYVLRIYFVRNNKGLINYHKKRYIVNYYEDLTDFYQYRNQVILYGERSVEKWIQEKEYNYYISDKINVEKRIPYFFKNKLIDNNVYIAQNALNLSNAFSIALKWIKYKYNSYMFASRAENVRYTLYSYVNANNITKYKVSNGTSKHSDIKIIGYKIEKTHFYTVLLYNI
jgi:hypothetical protein